MAEKRQAAWADESYTTEDGDYMVILVDEDEPGYHATTYTGTLDYTKQVAARINETRGITKDDAIEILASSMRVSDIK